MTKRSSIGYLVAVMAIGLSARHALTQSICLPGDIEKYAAKASSRSDVNLDRNMLGFAGNFLNKKDGDQAQAKQILGQLNSIVVHSYEFEEPGAYSPADLDQLRDHYKGAEWSHIVSTREQAKGKAPATADIWMHLVNGTSTGMVILSGEEKELTFVCIDGVLDPSMLSHLSGQFGIPAGIAAGDTSKGSGTKKPGTPLVSSDNAPEVQ